MYVEEKKEIEREEKGIIIIMTSLFREDDILSNTNYLSDIWSSMIKIKYLSGIWSSIIKIKYLSGIWSSMIKIKVLKL